MIASLRGRVESVGLDRAVIEAGGLGYEVLAAPNTLSSLRVGEETRLATMLVVREDSMTLYGFADADERAVFETVQTVSGVGPRLALAILAVHTPDQLRAAIAGEDLKALERVPGIGKKVASRLVLELKGKLGEGHAVPGAPVVLDDADEIVSALTQLGWPQRDSEAAVAAVGGDSTAERLRAALQYLAVGRG